MLQPLKDRLIIRRDEAAKFTESGLTIPEAAIVKELTGTVVAVGPDVTEEITVGTKVIFGKVDGVSLDNKYVDDQEGEYIMVRDEQVRGVLV